MESIVKDKIVTRIERKRNNLFSRKQYGFVPLKNCLVNLLICMEKCTETFEKEYQIDIIYADFTKAFDRAPQPKTSTEDDEFRNYLKHTELEKGISK